VGRKYPSHQGGSTEGARPRIFCLKWLVFVNSERHYDNIWGTICTCPLQIQRHSSPVLRDLCPFTQLLFNRFCFHPFTQGRVGFPQTERVGTIGCVLPVPFPLSSHEYQGSEGIEFTDSQYRLRQLLTRTNWPHHLLIHSLPE